MGPKIDVHVRFARSREAIFLDLCDERWRAVEVTKDGWRVVNNPPVFFKRYSGALPLPEPVRGGALTSLRPLLNAGDDAQWFLLLAWLVSAFQPDGSFPLLVLEGEQGSAKSTAARILLSMLDPSTAGLSAPPKNETDATVSALNAGILGYDNLSGCRAEISDVFCRLSTGQGFKTRTFYENLGLTVVSVKLPLLLNGIDATVMRGDLLERSIILKLPRITPQNRRTEQGIWDAFAESHPAWLGALLDAVSTGLKNLPTTVLTNLSRMADFFTWVTACEPALPWEPGQFLTAYLGRMEEANKDLAEDDSLACALMDWADQNLRFGTPSVTSAKDLLLQLNTVMQGSPRDQRYWPAHEGSLSHKLLRLAPVLRAQGIEILKLPRTATSRSRWEIKRSALQGLQVPRFIDQNVRKDAA